MENHFNLYSMAFLKSHAKEQNYFYLTLNYKRHSNLLMYWAKFMVIDNFRSYLIIMKD